MNIGVTCLETKKGGLYMRGGLSIAHEIFIISMATIWLVAQP